MRRVVLKKRKKKKKNIYLSHSSHIRQEEFDYQVASIPLDQVGWFVTIAW